LNINKIIVDKLIRSDPDFKKFCVTLAYLAGHNPGDTFNVDVDDLVNGLLITIVGPDVKVTVRRERSP